MYIGITPEKKGFAYLELVIELMQGDSNLTLKDAYEKISSIHNVNACTIDSSIRNAIHCAFSTGKLLRLNTKMGLEVIDSDYCPTNKVVVSYIIRHIKTNQSEINYQSHGA